MTALVVRGNAGCLPLPDSSVDLIVTSPPYFALRSYTDGGEHYTGQLGSEATPAEYIAALIECTREWVRVLKPSGSIFVNLGDSYAGGGGYSPDAPSNVAVRKRKVGSSIASPKPRQDVLPKSLRLLPERYRIACVDTTRDGYLHAAAVRRVINELADGEISRAEAHAEIDRLEAVAAAGSPGLGLIARAVICWSKPNGLPESVTDRVRRSHEDWVHLTKQPRYFAAVDEIREPHAEPNGRAAYVRERPPAPGGNRGLHVGRMDHAAHRDMGQSALGKLPGSVWTIPTEPLQVPERLAVDHFAAFPSEWPRRLILGWSPNGVCTACDEGRRPVVTGSGDGVDGNDRRTVGNGYRLNGTAFYAARAERPRTITGYACACPEPTAPTRPSVILDPFGGTGTTAHVAAALGRIGINVDLSADYCRLAAAPELQHARRRKVLGLDKPVLDPISEGQGSLLDMLSEGEPA